MKPGMDDVLLDAGGGTGEGFRQIWSYFKKVVVIDLNKKAMDKVSKETPDAKAGVGDVCAIPLRDKSVDFVFSNAVIEHIDRCRKTAFAKETRRVARKGCFIPKLALECYIAM